MIKDDFLKEVASWNNHLYLLWEALNITQGNPLPVCEFGAGSGSTPYLREYCKDSGREFLTYESNKEWAEKCDSTFVDNWNNPDLYKNYSVVLIDHAPGEHRHEAIAILADKVDIIVIHDSEVAATGYMLNKIWHLFRYRIDLITGGAGASMVSNKYDLSSLNGLQCGEFFLSIGETGLPCRNGHVLNGQHPAINDESASDKKCDCGIGLFWKEPCSCPGTPGWKITWKIYGT